MVITSLEEDEEKPARNYMNRHAEQAMCGTNTIFDCESHNGFISEVEQLVTARICNLAVARNFVLEPGNLISGKMLRTRMAARLAESYHEENDVETLITVSAATELVHTASLCHDDVIDHALLRRGFPTAWRVTSPSGAILMGDLLFCEAIDLIGELPENDYLTVFISKIREICVAEFEQEIVRRDSLPDKDTCIRVARGKTGPLFAFIGHVCGGRIPALSSALEEAGYLIGTAYQIADDLLDTTGNENGAGKTLGTDLKRGKFTLAHAASDDRGMIYGSILDLCMKALDCVVAWPEIREHMGLFLKLDLLPVLKGMDDGIRISVHHSEMTDVGIER